MDYIVITAIEGVIKCKTENVALEKAALCRGQIYKKVTLKEIVTSPKTPAEPEAPEEPETPKEPENPLETLYAEDAKHNRATIHGDYLRVQGNVTRLCNDHGKLWIQVNGVNAWFCKIDNRLEYLIISAFAKKTKVSIWGDMCKPRHFNTVYLDLQ